VSEHDHDPCDCDMSAEMLSCAKGVIAMLQDMGWDTEAIGVADAAADAFQAIKDNQ
jgi:hypothetical protein